jgi:hypothetical protein
MPKKTGFVLAFLCMILVLAAGLSQPPTADAAPAIFASPIQAGCYVVQLHLCKIHVDPFTIDIASGKKLVQFELVAINSSTQAQTTIYDFRTDQSNPVPFVGSTYSPSLVAQDFGATCGETYELSLQGKDSGDPSQFNLGLTNQFTCPKGTYLAFMPEVRKH